MKRKIILTMTMVLMMALIFALSISAETVLKPQNTNDYGDLSLFDESVTVGRTNTSYGFTPYIDAEGTTYARIVVGDGTTFYTFPTAYALSNSSIHGEGQKSIYFLDLTSLNSAVETATGTNPEWTIHSVYRIELPYNTRYLNQNSAQSFQNYSNVIEIYLQPNSSVKDQYKTMIFWKCKNLETIHNLDTFVFRKGCLGGSFQECEKLTSLTIGVSPEVTDTNDNLFNGCTALESVNFQEAFPNLQVIGKNTFYNCQKLQSFSSNGQVGAYVMQSSVTTIKQEAFYNCDAMKYLSISPAVTSIETIAFKDCSGLVFVDFNDNKNEFNVDKYGQFLNCTSLLAVSMPDNYKYIPNQMFKGCTALKAVCLPANLERMDTNGWGDDPFNGCKYLYFVQESFEVVDENGYFFTAEEFVQPKRPDVYYMPNSLSMLCTNKTSGKCFTNSWYMNPIVVFGTNVTTTTLGDGIFYQCGSNGTMGSGVTAVFLGDMEQLKVHTRDSRSTGVKYVFANANDKSLDDVNIINNATNSYALNDGTEGFYFCHGDCYYLLNGVKYAGTYSDEILTKIEGAVHYLEPNKTKTTDATCTTDRIEQTYCFCGAEIAKTEIENTALGHNHDASIEANISFVYESLIANGTKYVKCARCGINDEGVSVAAPFGTQGMSMTNDGYLQGYGVNKDALANYILVNGISSYEFGVIAGSYNQIGGNAPINPDGTTYNNKTHKFDYSDTDYVMFDIKIKGITEAYADEGIILCAYVILDGTVYYISNGVASTEPAFYSYNQVNDIVNATVPETVDFMYNTKEDIA